MLKLSLLTGSISKDWQQRVSWDSNWWGNGATFWQFHSTFRSRSLPLVELNSKVLAPPSHRSRQESIEICHQKLHDWVWTCHICADNPILARKFSEAGPSFLIRSFYFHEVTSHKSNLKLVPGTLSSLDCEADAPTLQPPAGKVETTPPPVAPPVAPPDLPSAPAAVPAPVTAPAEPKPDKPAEPDKPEKPETVPAVQSLQSEAGTAETLGWGQKPPDLQSSFLFNPSLIWQFFNLLNHVG